jgi:hypothetical protein
MNIITFLFLSLCSQFTIIDSVDIGDYANGVAYGSGFVWAVDNGVDRVFKIDPATMNIVSSFPYPGGLDGLGYDGEYLWIGIFSSSIHKVDTTGTCVGTWPSPGATYSYGMTFDGTYLWHSDKNVQMIYRLDYGNPTIVYESFAVSWIPRDLGWYGNHLWATANATTIYELEPSDMSIINSWPSGRENTAGIALGGGYLYFGSNNKDRGMVYKVDVPLALENVVFQATSCYPTMMLQWTTTIQPEMTAFLMERKTPRSDYEHITTIPCACGSPIIQKYSFEDETVLPGEFYLYRLWVILSNGERMGMATTSARLERRELSLDVSPNPFAASTSIYLTGMEQRAERIELKIYDVSGRVVRDLILDPSSFILGATAEWDGRDEDGRAVAPGIYFIRLHAWGKVITKKVSVIR